MIEINKISWNNDRCIIYFCSLFLFIAEFYNGIQDKQKLAGGIRI